MSKTKDVCAFFRKNRVIERALCALLLLFPILHALPHPTYLVGGAAVFLFVGYVLTYGAIELLPREWDEWLAWSLCGLLLLYGFLGYGTVLAGCGAALLLATYFPVRALLAERRVLQNLRFFAGLGAFVPSLYGIGQYFFGALEVKWVDLRLFSDIGGRVTSFFDNPNVLAIYLLFCFPLALGGAFDRSERLLFRSVCAASAVLILFCTVLTWTRGAWLGMLLQGTLFLVLHSKRTRRALLLFPLFFVLSAALLPPQVLRRFLSIGNLTESSNRYRIHTWRGVLRMIAAHPLGIGVGETAFRRVYPPYALMGTETVMHAHSVFLQVTCETGVIGGAVLLLWCISTVWRGRKSERILPMAGLLVMGLFDHLWYAPGMALLFACAMAIAAAEPQNGRERQENVCILHEKL